MEKDDETFYHKLGDRFGTKYFVCHQKKPMFWVCSSGFVQYREAMEYVKHYAIRTPSEYATIRCVNNIWPKFIKREILSHKLKSVVKLED